MGRLHRDAADVHTTRVRPVAAIGRAGDSLNGLRKVFFERGEPDSAAALRT